jgi:hypothetical protein
LDSKLKSEAVALVLLLLAFPAIGFGTTHDITVLWLAGLVGLVVGGALPIWTRYMAHSTTAPTDPPIDLEDRPSS